MLDRKTKKLFILLAILGIIILAILVINRLTIKPEISMAISDRAVNTSAQTFSIAKQPQLEDDDLKQGREGAQVKIFVYEDYASVYSAEMADTLNRIANDYEKEVFFVFRPYVLKSEPMSAAAASAVACAKDQGEKMRLEIFKLVKASALTNDSLHEKAVALGLDQEKFAACLSDLPSLEKSYKMTEDAKVYSVFGAPTLIINGSLLVGARPYDDYVDSNGDQIEGLKTVVSRLIN